MSTRPLHRMFIGLLAAALLAPGCGEDPAAPAPDADLPDPPDPPVLTDTRVPDFSLPDVNPSSPRAGTNVSPRDYEGQVSAWYFGHAT